MPRYFTHYWSKETFLYYKSIKEKEPINFIASNKFRQRGIASGDEVFIVSIFHDKVWLVGKLSVLGVCDCEEAAALVNWSVEDMWDAADYIVASQATSQNYELSISANIAQQLLFIRPTGDTMPIKFVGPGIPDTQTLRGVRELTPKSAALLSPLLPPMDEVFHLRGSSIRMEGSEEWAKSADAGFSQIFCSVCGADFQEKYGMLGRGLLHSFFLDKMRQSAEGNREFVCFNCQFMMGCIEPPLTADRLRRIQSSFGIIEEFVEIEESVARTECLVEQKV